MELLNLALQAALDHEILKEDEYLKSFLVVKVFSDCVQLIKNVEAPVQVKKEYFGGKWSSFKTVTIDRKVKTITVTVKVTVTLKFASDIVKGYNFILFKG